MSDALPESHKATALEMLANVSRTSTNGDSSPRKSQDQPRMRSSIACARCRRSKVKCMNNGVGTVCRACETAGRECTYPAPASAEKAKRREEGADGQEIPRPPARPRSKKSSMGSAMISTAHSPRAMVDALDPHLLTPKRLQELFEIWRVHYAVDLPFIHPPSFQKVLQTLSPTPASGVDFNSPPLKRETDPQLPREFLLAFLALTSRFHPTLVAHHSHSSQSRPSNPLNAANYYASSSRELLATVVYGTGPGNSCLATIQALLMLTVHEWSNCDGDAAWMLLGSAIRLAQLQGLHRLPDEGSEIYSRAGAEQPRTSSLDALSGQDFIAQESCRRTWWSCFNLDRRLSTGRRPQQIRIEDIHIQLPCSEDAFSFGDKVRTSLLSEALGESPRVVNGRKGSSASITPQPKHSPSSSRDINEDDVVWEVGSREGDLSRYIRVTEIFGRILKWTSEGGRLMEQYPPWDQQSTWDSLCRRIAHLTETLPRGWTLSATNIDVHNSKRSSLPSFLLIHTTLLLSRIILRREQIPFLPINCTSPKGPLDSRSPYINQEGTSAMPFGFWEQTTAELFQSGRDLLGLLTSVNEWKMLPQTPLVGFAAYTVALLAVYSMHFPWMDPKGYMSSNPASQQQRSTIGIISNTRDAETARKAVELVSTFQPHIRMADGWVATLARAHRYFIHTKKELRKNYNRNDYFPPTGDFQGRLTLYPSRMESDGYEALERVLQSASSAEDIEMTDAPEASLATPVTSPPSLTTGTGSVTTTGAGPARPDAWNAINTALAPSHLHPGPSGSPSTAPTNSPGVQSHSTTMSPPQTAYSTSGGFPPHPPVAQATAQAQPRQSEGAQWTAEQVEAWLDGLETRFGGDDIAAFCAGKDFREFAKLNGKDGWLKEIWRKSTQS